MLLGLALHARSFAATSGRQPALSMSSAALQLTRTRGDGNGGDGMVLAPSDQQYKYVVVWLHGLGDTADGWAAAMPGLQLPHTKFILPTAATRPITLNGGYAMPAWSDIRSIAADGPEDKQGLDASAARVQALLDKEKEKGIPSESMVVAGFSQGGALALHLCMRTADRLAACVSCSSWLPLAKDYPAAQGAGSKAGTPVLQCHGDVDNVVQYSWGQLSYTALKALGVRTRFETFRGMGHSGCPEEMETVSQFIKAELAKAGSK